MKRDNHPRKLYRIESSSQKGKEITPKDQLINFSILWCLFEMTRAIRTLLNCQSWCRLFPQKARLEKKGMSARHAIRRGTTALRGERSWLYRLTEGQHCSEVQCTLLCQSGMHTTLEHNGVSAGGRQRKPAKREYASSVSARRLQLFPTTLFLPLQAHFFPILFFPIHELQLTVERFWNASAFYGAAVPFITAGCSRIHTPIIKAEQDLAE